MLKSERIVKIMNTILSIPSQLLNLPALEMSAALQIISARDAGTPLHNIYDLAAVMQRGVYTARKISKSLESIGFLKREEQHDCNGRYTKSVWRVSLDFLFKKYDGEQREENRHTVKIAINGDFSHPEESESIEDILDIYLYVDTDTAERLNIEAATKKCKPEKVRKVLEALKTLQNCSETFIYSPKNKPMQSFSADEVAQIVTELDAQTFKKLCNHVNPRTNSLNYVFSALLNKWKCSKSAVDDRYSEALSGNHFTKKQMNSIIKAAETTCKSSEIGIVAGFLSVLWKKMQSYTYDKSKEYGYFMSMIKNAAAPTESNSSSRKHYQQASSQLKSSSSAPSYDLDLLFEYALTHTPAVKHA